MKLSRAVILIPILFLLVLFESAQQYYYVVSLNLIPNSNWNTFYQILEKQTTWWVIWLITLIPLTITVLKNQSWVVELRHAYKPLLLSILFFSLTVISFAVTQILLVEEEVSFLEVIIFKTFQKAPISLIAYAAVLLVLRLIIKEQYVEVLVENMSELENEIDQLKSEKVQVLVTKIGENRQVIKLKDVISIEADDYCVKLYLINDQKTTMRTTLKALEEKLPPNFIRIHRKHIVNLDFVLKFSKNGAATLTLSNDMVVNVSKSRMKEFESFLR